MAEPELAVDRIRCDGRALCRTAAELVQLDDWGYPMVRDRFPGIFWERLGARSPPARCSPYAPWITEISRRGLSKLPENPSASHS